jgi:dipeptidyl aminopeptidase/acylaminoacyl peptidase
VATASEDGVARIWDAETGRRLAALSGHRGPVTSLDFSPDSRYLATGSDDKTTRLWEVRGGRSVAELRGQTHFVSDVRFSPDGALVVTPDFEAVRVWEAATGRPLLVFYGHRLAVFGARFSPDGKRILTAGADNDARIYPCAICGSTEGLLALAGRQVGRSLTEEERERFAVGQ